MGAGMITRTKTVDTCVGCLFVYQWYWAMDMDCETSKTPDVYCNEDLCDLISAGGIVYRLPFSCSWGDICPRGLQEWIGAPCWECRRPRRAGAEDCCHTGAVIPTGLATVISTDDECIQKVELLNLNGEMVVQDIIPVVWKHWENITTFRG